MILNTSSQFITSPFWIQIWFVSAGSEFVQSMYLYVSKHVSMFYVSLTLGPHLNAPTALTCIINYPKRSSLQIVYIRLYREILIVSIVILADTKYLSLMT